MLFYFVSLYYGDNQKMELIKSRLDGNLRIEPWVWFGTFKFTVLGEFILIRFRLIF